MRNYNVYFEIYGKKLKTKVLAEDEADAIGQVRDKLQFNRVEEDKISELEDTIDWFLSNLK